MRLLSFFLLLLCLCLNGTALAQPSPYGSEDGNLGAWKWGKQQPPPQEETEDSDEATDQEKGGTSWERLQAERELPPAQEEQKTLTPLELWHALREKLW